MDYSTTSKLRTMSPALFNSLWEWDNSKELSLIDPHTGHACEGLWRDGLRVAYHMEDHYGKAFSKAQIAVASTIAMAGGWCADAFKPSTLGTLCANPHVVVYDGMVYSRDVWE